MQHSPTSSQTQTCGKNPHHQKQCVAPTGNRHTQQHTHPHRHRSRYLHYKTRRSGTMEKKTELEHPDLYKRTPTGRNLRWIPTGHHRQSNHLPLPPIRRAPNSSIILHSPQPILQSHTRTPRDDRSRPITSLWTPTHSRKQTHKRQPPVQ